MRQWIGFVLLFAFVILPACRHTPPSVVTPQGKVAYQLEDVIDVVGLLQHEAIGLNHAGKLPRPTALKVTHYSASAVTIISKAIDAGTGSAAAIVDVSNGLAELEKALTAPEQATLRAAIAAVRTVLIALGGK